MFQHSHGLAVGARSERYHAILHLKKRERGSSGLLRRDTLELFDHREDPGLERDLAQREPAVARQLAERLYQWLSDARGLAPERATLSDAERAALAALGYAGEGR